MSWSALMATVSFLAGLLVPLGARAEGPCGDRLVVGLAAELVPWDREEHGTYGGDWSGVDTAFTAGFQLFAGYRPWPWLEAGLAVSLTFPRQETGLDGRLTARLLRVAPRVKGLLPLPWGASAFVLAQVGWARVDSPAYYGDGVSSGLAWGLGAGVEVPVVGPLQWLVAVEVNRLLQAEIERGHGHLRYQSLAVVTGPLLRL